MTRPLARSLPMTRRLDRTGHSFVPSHLCLPVAFGRMSSTAYPLAFDSLPLSGIHCFGQHVIGSPYRLWTRTAD
jgi:hypothetical protein